MPKFDFQNFENIKDRGARLEFLSDAVKALDVSNPIELSDLLVRKAQKGAWVLQALGNSQQNALLYGQQPAMWRLQVISDEWGNVLSKGDTITRKIPKSPYKPDGKKFTSKDYNISKLNGTFDQDYYITKSYPVDAKGCITCNFEDAVFFLNTNGVHYNSGRTLTEKPKLSKQPLQCPNGQKLHKHHWRYKEVPNNEYEKLKNRPKRVGPRRGVDSLDKIEAFREAAKKAEKAGAEAVNSGKQEQ